MKPSTGAPVRNRRNAVRDQLECLSAIDWNRCPRSLECCSFGPESIGRCWRPTSAARLKRSSSRRRQNAESASSRWHASTDRYWREWHGKEPAVDRSLTAILTSESASIKLGVAYTICFAV